jgi:hypothetical protein
MRGEQMRIAKIELKNVKSFDGLISATFSPETSMFAFSGMNGAGKSTFLKMAWLIQKAHFARNQYHETLATESNLEVRRFLNAADSFARLTLIVDQRQPTTEADIPAAVDLTIKLSLEGQGFKMEYSDEALANYLWEPENPSNLILYVDASKGFSEQTLHFDEIDIDKNERNALALEAIYYPERLFTGIYRQLVKDYVHDRLIPSKPDRLLYYHVASKLFTRLIPNVELKNFSGNYKPKEFVLLGKANTERYKPLYDVREFSSGEKALLSTLTFLCISKSVSALIIDEPENHFHESLLLEFMALLNELCEKDGIINWIASAEGTGKKIKQDWIAAEYSGYNLNQVIVSTHSKPLIYKFFSIGKNFIINKQVREISYESAEVQLREIGLSTTFTKVLFVEGTGDHQALENLLKAKNIKIKSLSGSTAVIDTFKRLASIKDYVQDSRFIFLVDSDNKPPSFFQELRAIAPSFYDAYFIKLTTHEFENLYLEPSLFKQVLDGYAKIAGAEESDLSIEEVKTELVRLAGESLPQVYKKELSLAFTQAVERHFASLIWGNKSFSWSDAVKVTNDLQNALSQSNTAILSNELSTAASQMFSSYGNVAEDVLLRRCDGKQVFNKACSFFATHASTKLEGFRKAVYSAAEKSSTSAVSALAQEIDSKLKNIA